MRLPSGERSPAAALFASAAAGAWPFPAALRHGSSVTAGVAEGRSQGARVSPWRGQLQPWVMLGVKARQFPHEVR